MRAFEKLEEADKEIAEIINELWEENGMKVQDGMEYRVKVLERIRQCIYILTKEDASLLMKDVIANEAKKKILNADYLIGLLEDYKKIGEV